MRSRLKRRSESEEESKREDQEEIIGEDSPAAVVSPVGALESVTKMGEYLASPSSIFGALVSQNGSSQFQCRKEEDEHPSEYR